MRLKVSLRVNNNYFSKNENMVVKQFSYVSCIRGFGPPPLAGNVNAERCHLMKQHMSTCESRCCINTGNVKKYVII